MNLRKLAIGLVSGAVLAVPIMATKAQAAEIFIPLLTYRSGPYAPNGIPIANGLRDYWDMLNKRDGGVGGVKIAFEECEFGYNTGKGVECYEKLKVRKPVLVNPFSTGLTYKLIPKASVDKIVVHSMGYGRTIAADGRVFPWVFAFPTNYWSQASAFIKYIGSKEGGMSKLKGKKIALIYHNSAYGKEPIPTLQVLAKKFGFKLTTLAVDHPGQEQKATWLQIRRLKPNWILLWGWGVMNQVAIKSAAEIGYPMNRFIGVWWSGTEADVVPAGAAAKGYLSGTFHGSGPGYKLFEDILKYVYGGDIAKAQKNKWGDVLYNRGVINAVYSIEAIRTAQKHFKKGEVDGTEVRWGYENLNLTAARLKAIGLEGFTKPVKVTCADHETSGPVMIQQWTGQQWVFVSDWIEPMRDIIRPMIEAGAAAYAKEHKITLRKNCT